MNEPQIILKIKSFDSIMFLKGDTNYTTLNYRDGKTKMIAHTLKRFEETAFLSHWQRIHRSYLVNPKFIESVDVRYSMIYLKTGLQLPIARRRLLPFIEQMNLK
jgi:DNA-binding LytR/AlgR family response regulator